MSVYLHPALALLWALTIVGRGYLAFRSKRAGKVFQMWVCQSFALAVVLFIESASNQPEAYWYTFWVASTFLHVLVAIYAVLYGYECLKLKPCLPKSCQANAMIVMITLASVCVAASYISKDGAGVMYHVEHGLELWVCGLVWIALLVGKFGKSPELKQRVLQGFMWLYSFGLLASTVRLYCPLTRVELWAFELWAEVVAVGYWIYALRETE